MMSANNIRLSYVLTTFNKLPYVKATLPDLIAACTEDEEIVVYDGGSSDGTKEYLEEQYKKGLIHQFVSERDFGEANGYNKAILSAKGELIKIISDDDAYDFEGIRKCKEFMLVHPDVQIVGGDGYGVNNLLQSNQFTRRHAINHFREWQATRTPFIFCGLSIIFRKDALPLIGFWNPNFLIIDFEYTLRVTASKARIGWYTGLIYVNIVNQQSNSGRHWKRMEMEREKLEFFYFGKKPLISFKVKDRVKNIFRPLKYRLFPSRPANPQSYEQVYMQSKQLLKAENEKLKHEVLV
jgi:glycosyltransferase involved in cell wall biosynthesis